MGRRGMGRGGAPSLRASPAPSASFRAFFYTAHGGVMAMGGGVLYTAHRMHHRARVFVFRVRVRF